MEMKVYRDDFDDAAASSKVRGAHRKPQSNRPWWIALVAVIVASPILGVLIGFMMGNN